MSKFFEQMAGHFLARQAQRHDPRISAGSPDVLIHAFLVDTAPFAECPPGHIWDVRERRSKEWKRILCPKREALLQSLAIILAEYGMLYAQVIELRPADERYELKNAIRTIQLFLEGQSAPRRHKKLWCQFEAIAQGLETLAQGAYAHPGREQQDWIRGWRKRLTRLLYDAFRAYGPARDLYCDDAIFHALAAILIPLRLENGDSVSIVAARLAKRWAAARITD
jgi:hypothetical protein